MPTARGAGPETPLMTAGTDGTAKVVVAVVVMALVIWRHRSNLQRIVASTEPKIGQKA
ncbi:hypothetical protein RS9916_34142 [Synechococcus sp. RS9916]|nr:hypothetical protein RS9916_34142 [Synechococcus sp. RS9916]